MKKIAALLLSTLFFSAMTSVQAETSSACAEEWIANNKTSFNIVGNIGGATGGAIYTDKVTVAESFPSPGLYAYITFDSTEYPLAKIFVNQWGNKFAEGLAPVGDQILYYINNQWQCDCRQASESFTANHLGFLCYRGL